MNVRYRVTLSVEEREVLRELIARGRPQVRRVKRAQILLGADAGQSDEDLEHARLVVPDLGAPTPGKKTPALTIPLIRFACAALLHLPPCLPAQIADDITGSSAAMSRHAAITGAPAASRHLLVAGSSDFAQ